MTDSIQRDTAFARIQESLAPLIGESMARSSLKLHSEKLGINGAELSREQADALLAQIGLAMRVFVGAERADALTAEILTQLFREGA